MDDSEDRSSNPRIAEGAATIQDLIKVRFTRRGFVAGAGAAAIASSSACVSKSPSALSATPDIAATPNAAATSRAKDFGFKEIERGVDGAIHAPEGYRADLLLRWGDPVFPDAPAFDPHAQNAAAQMRQFGYNNDFIGFHPLQADGRRGLLCVNHEYTSTRLMFPGARRAPALQSRMRSRTCSPWRDNHRDRARCGRALAAGHRIAV